MVKTVSLAALVLLFMGINALAAETAVVTDGTPNVIKSALSPEQLKTGHSAKPAGHSMIGLGTEAPDNAELIRGKVLETMNNGGYSYILLQKKNGDKIWVAVMETPVETGSLMSFRPGIVMSNFESKGLKRTFDTIIFTDVQNPSPPAGATLEPAKKQVAHPVSKSLSTAKDQKIAVAKATGADAITVEEAFVNSTKLDKKRVVVSGKVVKVSAGIMKQNWIHIQDGTGSQADGTHNLVCTSQDLASVGDVVTVSGTLVKDRDFGSGYRYTVIIERAKFTK